MVKDLRAHTTLPVADLERAKQWYSGKLGLTPAAETEGAYFYVLAGGTGFSLYPTPNTSRGGHTQMGLAATDLEAEVAALRERGVVFEEYDFPGLKTEKGIAQTGNVRAAWFKDCDNNIIGVVELPAEVATLLGG
jgi:catechol 2,3-dioxygenase-like lactoylglutathione lyase family enzyme